MPLGLWLMFGLWALSGILTHPLHSHVWLTSVAYASILQMQHGLWDVARDHVISVLIMT